MALSPIIREKLPEVPAGEASECIHCYGSGWIYEATEEEAYECHMCLGTGRKMDRAERIMVRADRHSSPRR